MTVMTTAHTHGNDPSVGAYHRCYCLQRHHRRWSQSCSAFLSVCPCYCRGACSRALVKAALRPCVGAQHFETHALAVHCGLATSSSTHKQAKSRRARAQDSARAGADVAEMRRTVDVNLNPRTAVARLATARRDRDEPLLAQLHGEDGPITRWAHESDCPFSIDSDRFSSSADHWAGGYYFHVKVSKSAAAIGRFFRGDRWVDVTFDSPFSFTSNACDENVNVLEQTENSFSFVMLPEDAAIWAGRFG